MGPAASAARRPPPHLRWDIQLSQRHWDGQPSWLMSVKWSRTAEGEFIGHTARTTALSLLEQADVESGILANHCSINKMARTAFTVPQVAATQERKGQASQLSTFLSAPISLQSKIETFPPAAVMRGFGTPAEEQVSVGFMVEGPQQRLDLLMGGEGVTQMPPPWPTIRITLVPTGAEHHPRSAAALQCGPPQGSHPPCKCVLQI